MAEEKNLSKYFVPDMFATITVAGNIVKVTSLTRHNSEQTIQVLPGGDQYVTLSTGEVKEIHHTESRAENIQSVRQTFQRLAMLVNANTEKPYKCRFVTLTYADNMRDLKKLYHDFSLFWKRFRYFCQKQGHDPPEYIAVAEPQARGAWHLHVIIIFEKRAPFIENTTLADLWGHGFVHIRSIDNVDNVGAYLTAYLADVELPDGDDLSELQLPDGSFQIVEKTVEGKSKRFIKGGRLHLYPTGMRIYRCSKGVKRPVQWQTTLGDADRYTGDMVLTYSRFSSIQSENGRFGTTLYTAFYNRVRPGKTAFGFNDPIFGPMRRLSFSEPKPAKDSNPPPYEVISDEEFEKLMPPKPEWQGNTPDWAKDSNTAKEA